MTGKTSSFFKMFSEQILEAVEGRDLSDDQIAAVVESVVEGSHKGFLEALKEAAPEMLAEEVEQRNEFEAGNGLRWKEPLELLTMLFRICSEIGEAHAHEGPYEVDPLLFDTLARLHPRGLLAVSEVHCLLRGGFADAALARWRTLHEIVVVSMFVAKHGIDAALPYRLNFAFASERASKQYNEYAERANLKPFTSEELSAAAAESAGAEQRLGRRLKTDWDWAAAILGTARPTFFDLERDVGLDHWRPRYKWASQNTHAGYREMFGTLGMSEAKQAVFQIGPSNSGLVDPIHMVAIALMNLTTTFVFFPKPNLDRVVMTKVLQAIVDEIGETALIASRRTAEDSEQIR